MLTPQDVQDKVFPRALVGGYDMTAVDDFLETMTEEVEAHPERDIWLYHGPTDRVRIGNGRFAVLFPEDAHAPGIAVDQPAPARKCVVKVRVKQA